MKNSSDLRQIEGRNSVIEALKSPNKVIRIFIDQGAQGEKIKTILSLARKKRVKTIKKTRKFLERLSKTGTSQGIIAQAESLPSVSIESIFKKTSKEEAVPFFIILTETLYEYNLGAVIRTSEVAGVDAVIISKRSKGVTSVVNRVSMGAVEYVPIIQTSLFQAIKKLKKEGCKIIGASPQKGKFYFKENLKVPLVLVIGGEDKDISDPLAEKIDYFIKIPMFGEITSLNLSTAAGILIFETVRQRMM